MSSEKPMSGNPNANPGADPESREWSSPTMQPQGKITVSGLGKVHVPSVGVTVNKKGAISPATIPMKKEN